MTKSIEPIVTSWSNNQLINNGVEIALEQGSLGEEIDSALSKEPSKQGGDGTNRTDAKFMITNGALNIPVIIEYKGTEGKLKKLDKNGLVYLKNKNHEYEYGRVISKYAVNGAAYYASVILRHTEFPEVICVGVNGYHDDSTNKNNYLIDAYVSNSENPDLPIHIGEYSDMSFLFKDNWNSLINKIEEVQMNPEEVHKKALADESSLDKVLKDLNQHLHDDNKIIPRQRIFIVSASIMAAIGVKDKKNDNYIVSPLEPSELSGDTGDGETDGDKIMRKVSNFLKSRNIPEKKQKQVKSALNQVVLYSNLSDVDDRGLSPLKSTYLRVYNNLIPAYKSSITLDFTGKLFNVMNDWVDVPDGDQNDVVLTPRYVTNLMARLASVNMNSYVWDWALGSGGFLISSMNIMLKDAKKKITSPLELENKLNHIKNEQLLGIEKLPDIYVLAVLNMILVGDGSSNIINENSLKDFNGKYAYPDNNKKFPANVFLLNPPYSAEGKGMIFVEEALRKMNSGHAAIIIMDSAGSGKATDFNKRILKNNRLVASIKMPSDMFKASVQTSIYVFEIGVPQDQNYKTKFIDFREDGYKRSNRRKSSRNLVDSGTANKRYNDLVNVVVNNGIDDSKFLSKGENYFEDSINPLDGNDWNYEKHIKIDTTPSYNDFRSTVGNYMSWEINELLK